MIIIPFFYVILYVIFCWLMAFMGRYTKFGFWGNFWVNVIFTPIIGILVLVAQESRPPEKVAAHPPTRTKNA